MKDLLEFNNIISKGEKFYKDLKKDNNGRYKSWEYCYSTFHKAHLDNNIDEAYLDYLSLHLAFYLASWGMYRGSSFLLQRDYKIHKGVILELFKEKYSELWGIELNLYKEIRIQELLIDLTNNISEIYNEIRLSVKENEPKNDISLTLVTKALMGTMGCVPAYDRYFISGIKYFKVSTGNYNINSILKLVDFYEEYFEDFENVRKNMKIDELEYPQMKLLDMCFWQVGFDLDGEKGLKNSH